MYILKVFCTYSFLTNTYFIFQVGSRTLPEGSCWSKGGWERQLYRSHPIPEHRVSEWVKSRLQESEQSKPWIETGAPPHSNKLKHTGTNTTGTSTFAKHAKADLSISGEKPRIFDTGKGQGISGIGGPTVAPASLNMDPAERAEQNWNRRGPSPIQRNILARKLKEAQSNSGYKGRQRSSTFSESSSEQRKGRCHSLPVSGNSSLYRLSEAEQRMLDLDLPSTYVGEME